MSCPMATTNKISLSGAILSTAACSSPVCPAGGTSSIQGDSSSLGSMAGEERKMDLIRCSGYIWSPGSYNSFLPKLFTWPFTHTPPFSTDLYFSPARLHIVPFILIFPPPLSRHPRTKHIPVFLSGTEVFMIIFSHSYILIGDMF